jgi:DedD protein
MAFFKFRKGDDNAPSATAQTESVEVLRRRARHRLIGAAVLVLLGVIGFPLLFDTQPRPVAVDIPIDIPDRNKAKPLPAPPPSAAKVQGKASEPAPAPVAAAPAPVAAPAAAPVAAAKPEAVPDPRPAAREPAKAELPAAPKPAPVAKAEPAKAAAPDGARAQALLEGKSSQAVEGRFVVQVGAFSDVAKARETRLKVEKAGLKTYTHVAETKDGKRIRVRVGPFPTRAEADKAAHRIKDLDLPAAILTL